MQIVVGNPSYQNVHFHYAVPEFERPFVAKIGPGKQEKLLPLDMTEDQAKSVVIQIERYGGVPESDINSLTTARGLIFSVRRPMTENQMDQAREKDEENRQKVSDKETENAGVATVPTVLPPAIQEAMRKTQQNSTLHVEQVEHLEGEQGGRAVKGGVNMTVKVSKQAGERKRTTG